MQPSDGFKRLLLEYGSQQSIAVNKYHVYISIITKLCCTSITSRWFAIWKLNKLCSKKKNLKKNSILHLPKGATQVSIYSRRLPTFGGRNVPAERQSRARAGGQLPRPRGAQRTHFTPFREPIPHGSIGPETSPQTRSRETLPACPESRHCPEPSTGRWHRSVHSVCQALRHILRNTPRNWRFLALSLPPRKNPV